MHVNIIIDLCILRMNTCSYSANCSYSTTYSSPQQHSRNVVRAARPVAMRARIQHLLGVRKEDLLGDRTEYLPVLAM